MRKSTARKMKADREVYLRETTEVWFPKGWELALPDVPEGARKCVRLLLKSCLGKVSVKSGDCWNTAQQLMLNANNERIQYVEGVWTRAKSNAYAYNDDTNPAPHAWNLVDGHVVDLTAEFYNWRTWGDDAPWLHEAFKVYSVPEFEKYREEVGEVDGFSMTVAVCAQGWAQDFSIPFSDEDYAQLMASEAWEDVLFQPAAELMQAVQS